MNFVQDLCEDLYELFKVHTSALGFFFSFLCLCFRTPPLPSLGGSMLLTVFVFVFPQRDKGFDKTMFERQMSVMRGQVSGPPLPPLLFYFHPFCMLPHSPFWKESSVSHSATSIVCSAPTINAFWKTLFLILHPGLYWFSLFSLIGMVIILTTHILNKDRRPFASTFRYWKIQRYIQRYWKYVLILATYFKIFAITLN